MLALTMRCFFFSCLGHLNGCDVFAVEFILDVAQHKAGFAHAALAQQHHFEAAGIGHFQREVPDLPLTIRTILTFRPLLRLWPARVLSCLQKGLVEYI